MHLKEVDSLLVKLLVKYRSKFLFICMFALRETLFELSPLKAALPLLIASAVTELAPACCFAAPGALCLMAVMAELPAGSLSRSLALH